MLRATGPRTSRKNATRSVGSTTVAVTSSLRPRTEIVAEPAARRLRTHWTSPQGAQTQRLPEAAMIATGVVRGRPLFRPRMVMSPLKPIGTPAANKGLASGLKNETDRGTLRARHRPGLVAHFLNDTDDAIDVFRRRVVLHDD